ncbi:hypothetical protein G6F60_010545 [Rhizopus arrhizus]|nr:hypothetical protein G6F60_010545 [Rhizopus arrhizus]
MSDPINTSNVEQQIFTKEQVDALIEAVTKRVRETQAEEAEQRNKGFEIPVEICEELDSYNTFELQKALQKFKRSVPKYNNEDWNTPESTNPNFIPQLKQGKVDTLQLVSTIYKHTENTRAQARAASEIFESLQYISERGMQQEDEELYHTTMEKARRLAVFGFGTARQQENEAKEATTKSLRLPYSLKHLETPESGEKKYAFSNEFIEQYYEETFKQKVTSEASRSHRFNNNSTRGRGGGFRGNGYREGRPFLSNRGRGRGGWQFQRGDQPNSAHDSTPRTNQNDHTQ